MGGQMTSYYKSFLRRKKGKQKRWQKKGRRKRNYLVFKQYINACKVGANWDGQDFKTIKVDHNNFQLFNWIFSHFLCGWNMSKV
jgi:hypothetical protein